MNHCVAEKIKTNLDWDLLELNCNVRPLDGLARRQE